jgi:hypothetical protein
MSTRGGMKRFKAHIRTAFWAVTDARMLTQQPLPRFLWTAAMLIGGVPSRLLVFDATDTLRTCPLLYAIWLDGTYQPLLDALFADATFESFWRTPFSPQLYDALKAGKATFL